MINDDLYSIEKWKTIPIDSKFIYQASNLGRISHLYPDGTRKVLKECYVKSLSGWVTGVVMADGTYRKFQTISLVARAWIGVRGREYQAVHKNGILSDHRVSNIIYVKRSEIGKIANKSKRKPVVKINYLGEIVEVYSSARECAEKNNYQYSTIKRRCCGDFKSVFASDGYAYCYEDDSKRLGKTIRRIEMDFGYMPKAANCEFDW